MLRVPDIPGISQTHRVACHWTEQIESGEIQPHKVEAQLIEQHDAGGEESLMGPASISEAL